MGWYKRTFKTRNKITPQIHKAHNHTWTAIMKELNSTDLGICPLIEEEKKCRNFHCHEADLGSAVDFFSFSPC